MLWRAVRLFRFLRGQKRTRGALLPSGPYHRAAAAVNRRFRAGRSENELTGSLRNASNGPGWPEHRTKTQPLRHSLQGLRVRAGGFPIRGNAQWRAWNGSHPGAWKPRGQSSSLNFPARDRQIWERQQPAFLVLAIQQAKPLPTRLFAGEKRKRLRFCSIMASVSGVSGAGGGGSRYSQAPRGSGAGSCLLLFFAHKAFLER